MRGALALALLATGCDVFCDHSACGPCPPALTITVTRASGDDPAGVRVEGVDGVFCGDVDAGAVICSVASLAPGAYPIVVRADGEAPVDLVVSVARDHRACCSCGTIAAAEDVELGGAPPVDEDSGPLDEDAGP
jgi:hypothetical protein